MATTTQEKLDRLAAKQAEWSKLPAERKLFLLEEMLRRFKEFDGYSAASDRCVSETMGMPLTTEEGDFQQSLQSFLTMNAINGTLRYLIQAYKYFAGKEPPPQCQVREKPNGQLAIKVFPLLSDDKSGPFSTAEAELYLDPEKIKSEKDIKIYDWEFVVKEGKAPGAAVVLGAGNYGLLTLEECFDVLFRNNRVTLVKHHPLREYHDEAIRFIMKPVLDAGYFETEMDKDFERNALYSDKVALVHMTGGKATHDMIVWGPTEKERQDRKKKKNPLLKAQMNSELGCVTPWVVPLVTLTDKELVEQATAFAKSVYQNCSFACNSPKVLVVSSEWKQRDEFVDKMAEFLKTNPTPPAYYPGVIQRWEAFREAYPKAREIGCQLDTEKRQLSKPMLQDRPVVLPWLISEIEVDLSTPEGRKKAEAEYALKNETFGPVFAIATVRSSNKPKEFMDTAVDLCNNYMFGSLSITMTVPQHLQGDAMIEEAFTQLRYGTIVTNSWPAFSYNMKGLPWGAYPGEKLEDVESGIGSVHQYCFVQHVVKGVALFHKGVPGLVWPPHTRENAAVNRALVNVTLKPGVYTVFMLIWALIVAQVWPMLKKVFGYS